MARKRATDLSKTDMTMLVLIVLLVIFGLAVLFSSVNIMAEYVSATLPVILRNSYLPQHWVWE